jgi:hypothetical protein
MSDIYWTEEEDDGQEPEPEEDATSGPESNILAPGGSPEEALAKVRGYQEDWVKYGVDRVHKHYDLPELPIPTVYLEPEENGPELSHSPRGMFRILKKFIRVLLG